MTTADPHDANAREQTREYPYAFASNDPAFRAISSGVLWLISSPTYGKYRLPPSLVARLNINEVVARDDPVAQGIDVDVVRSGAWIALADRDRSVYLPLNNAYDLLHHLGFQARSGQLMHLPSRVAQSEVSNTVYSKLPGYFQRHRVVDRDSVAVLEKYARAVMCGRRIFVSYRWSDFENNLVWLQEFTDTLVANTASCWWDRRNVPPSEVNEFQQQLLSAILDDAIRQSVFFVALMKDDYFKPNTNSQEPTWVRKEWDRAGQELDLQSRRQQMTRLAAVFGDQPSAQDWIAPSDVVIHFAADESADTVARALVSRLPPLVKGLSV